MKKLIWLLSFLFLLISCSKADLAPITIKTSNGDVLYFVEIADTPDKMIKGLMYREHLKSDSGMIFIFDADHSQPIAMWMKNTFISLDMLFLNENKEIIAIYENAEPLSLKTIRPTLKPSAYVIELNAGEVKKHGIKPGDKILY
ncbi:MAG: DUF192 domain-containing protein [Alphaproteobacteria bacterium]|nr:DUF192 domain-containing protein [Alphaproteobacteria bacterium]